MEDIIHFKKISIFGVGLIGGAIGMAVRKLGIADHVTGIGRSKERLETARTMGALDDYKTDIAAGASDCDLFIFCLPVQKIIENFPIVARSVKPGCIVTDVGSTKKTIIDAATSLFGQDKSFIGSHPMTGSDKSGCANAHEVVLNGVTCFVTVTHDTNYEAVAKVTLFWKALGMIPVLIDPLRHDEYVALVSHLPHIAAVALVNTVASCPEDLNFIRQITGRGFKDTTRIAMGDILMWLDICQENKDNINRHIDKFIGELDQIKASLQRKDLSAVQTFLERAKAFREKFD